MAKAKQGVEAAPKAVSEEPKKAVAVVRPIGIPANAVPVADCSEEQAMKYSEENKLVGFNPVSKIAWIIPALLLAFSMFVSPAQVRADMGDEATLGGFNDDGSYRFRVNSSGNFIPGKDSSTNLGASGSEFANINADSIDATDDVTVTTGSAVGLREGLVADTGIDTQYSRIQPMYLELYARQASLRPASTGPRAGQVVMISNANNTGDCGTAGGGSTFVVCVSTGSSWRAL